MMKYFGEKSCQATYPQSLSLVYITQQCSQQHIARATVGPVKKIIHDLISTMKQTGLLKMDETGCSWKILEAYCAFCSTSLRVCSILYTIYSCSSSFVEICLFLIFTYITVAILRSFSLILICISQMFLRGFDIVLHKTPLNKRPDSCDTSQPPYASDMRESFQHAYFVGRIDCLVFRMPRAIIATHQAPIYGGS